MLKKHDDGCSASETLIAVGDATVNWASSTHRCIMLPTVKADYDARGEGVTEALFTGGVFVYSPRAGRIYVIGFSKATRRR